MPSKLTLQPDVTSNIDLLTAWIEAQMAYSGLPGLSIGIVHDQELVWTVGFGYADLENRTPATSRTLYRIASITKLFTATALLQLRDAGHLQLDDPITKHLDWFNIRNRHPDSPPITIRHLLAHTSGLPREAAFAYWTDSRFPSIEEIKEALPNQETILPPETEWKYSNLAITLAGEIVAAVSGQAYEDYIRQNILDPLNMSDTCVRTPSPKNALLATGYGRRLPDGSRTQSAFTDGRGLTAAFNMASNVEDLARFVMLQFRRGPAGGSQILSGNTLREMQRVHWLEPDWQAGWGLGFRVIRECDRTFVEHGGAVLGYRTHIRLCPTDKTGVVVLTSADDGEPVQFVEKAFQWLAPAIVEACATEPERKTRSQGWDRYVGKYRFTWGDMQVLVLNGTLIAIDPSVPDPSVDITRLLPVAEHTFRMETRDGYGSHGELMVFELDAAGNVERVKIGVNYTYPVKDW